MSEPIPLIVPVLNNFEGFFRLIQSIHEPVRPYIVDNTEKNFGVAKSWNVAGRRALEDGFRYAVFANDDCYFEFGQPSDLVSSLLKCSAAIMSADPSIVKSGECFVLPSSTFREHSPFYLFAADLKVLDEVGWFDEQFYPCYFEDNDMELRLGRARYEVFRDWSIHAPHETIKPPNVRYPDIFQKNELKFKKKYEVAWQPE